MPATTADGGATVLGRVWALFDRVYPLNLIIYMIFWPLLELLFYFRVCRFLRVRGAQVLAHCVDDTAEVERFWSRAMAEEEAPVIDTVLRGWFLGDTGQVCEGNLHDLVSWTLHARPTHELSSAQRAKAARVLMQLTKRVESVGVYPPGRNSRLQCMLHSLEPLVPCHKPLIFYLVWQTVRELTWALLRRRGYELRTHGTLSYWFHPGSPPRAGAPPRDGNSSPPPPIVFLHGVGGLVTYIPLLLELRASQPHSAQIVPFMAHCSLVAPAYDPSLPLDASEFVDDLAATVRAYADASGATAARALFFGHSLGTAFLASVVKAHPSLVGAAVLVDPICFLLFYRDVVYNFLYAEPKPLRHGLGQALHVGYWFRLALHYLLKQEPTIQSCFRREFSWARHWLHPSDMHFPAYVSLSGRDAIVPSHKVHAHLSSWAAATAISEAHGGLTSGSGNEASGRGVEVALHARRHHGWSMLDPFARRVVVSKVDELLKKMVRRAQERGASPLEDVPLRKQPAAVGETEDEGTEEETGEEESTSTSRGPSTAETHA